MSKTVSATNLRLNDEVRAFGANHRLSNREGDIILLLVNGYASSEEIARRLNVSVSTVKNHLHSIFQKSKSDNKAELLSHFIAYIYPERLAGREGGSQTRLKVVVADDDESFRELVHQAIKRTGREGDAVEFFQNGEDLMGYLRSNCLAQGEAHPDLIILDLHMPKMGGLRCMEEIKNESELSRIPVIAVTHSDDEKDIERSYNLGAHSYFVKPSAFADMVELMTTILTFWGSRLSGGGARRAPSSANA